MMTHVLLIEDDQSFGATLQCALEHNNHQVTWVTTGADAIAAFAEPASRFDLVLLDLGLPDMTGHEVLQRFGVYEPGWSEWLPVVVVSGSNDLQNRIYSFQNGVILHLPKGMKLDALLRVCAKARDMTP